MKMSGRAQMGFCCMEGLQYDTPVVYEKKHVLHLS